MKYISTTEHAAQIRADLKARGISSRQVSVRADLYSLGSSIRIKIKDPNISIRLVREIAKSHEHIDRDERTGEILGGGNRFVSVDYAGSAKDALSARYLDTVQAAADTLPDPHDSVLAPLGEYLYLGRRGPYTWTVWPREGEGRVQSYCSLPAVALHLAEVELEAVSA